LEVCLFKPTDDESRNVHFNSKCGRVWSQGMIEYQLDLSIEHILKTYEVYQERGSNFVLDRIVSCSIHLGKFQRSWGGCYNDRLPNFLKNKHALVNVKCGANECFLYATLASLYPQKYHAERTSVYRPYIHNLKNLPSFPVHLDKIKKFEEANKLAVNIYSCDFKEVYPVRVSKVVGREVNLFLHNKHFYTIRNFNRLVSNHNHRYVCHYCLFAFNKKTQCLEHEQGCRVHGVQKVSYAAEGATFSFSKHTNHFKQTFVIYADFEALIINNTHCICSYCYIVVDADNKVFHQDLYCGPNAAEHFLESVFQIVASIKQILACVPPVSITPEQKLEYERATVCHLCKSALNGDKVLDHDHWTSLYRGPAHNRCNLEYKNSQKIRCFFHNGKGYDFHFILKAIPNVNYRKINIIPLNSEKFLAVIIDDIIFLDSMQFLPASLDTLSSNIPTTEFHVLKQCFPALYPLLRRKGVYPYERMNCWERFDERVLPDKEHFTSSLTNTPITQEEHDYALRIWKKAGCKTMLCYHNLYLQTDTALLADVFQAFRTLALTHYKLDPVLNFSSPGLSLDAALKMTGVELELLSDPAMYLMCEKLRGGVSFISHRYARANNSAMKSYDASLPTSYLYFLDANNLYG